MIEREELRGRLEQVRAATTGYRVYLAHLIPDNMLYQYALDVYEQSLAVLSVADTVVPRAAMSNARSANEACLDMLTLVSDPARYDEHGAFARACELLETQDLLKRRDAADRAAGLEPRPDAGTTPEEIVASEGLVWERESPGSLRMYERVFEQVKADGRWKRHWSGAANRFEQLRSLEHWLDADGGFALQADALYGLQSNHAHGRPRTGQRKVTRAPDGTVTYETNRLDAAFPLSIADLACMGALQAIGRRATLIR